MTEGVSVVIPVHNGAMYLADCVSSVLAQTRPVETIIVIDDGSEDDTGRVAARLVPHICYERQDHRGAADARNAGQQLVHTEYVAFLDCDDLWLPEKLERQLVKFHDGIESAMVFGHVEHFLSVDLSVEETASWQYEAAPVPGWSASTLLMRNGDFARAGPFDPTLRIGEFIEWFGRAVDAGLRPIMLADVLCRRRLHRGNLGRRADGGRKDYARALKKLIDRRRRSS